MRTASARLQNLADALGAPPETSARVPLQLPGLPTGSLNSLSVAQIIAQLTPDHAIYADESNTSSLPLLMMLARARPHTHLPLAGGSIGQGLPLAVGAALAAPDRKVVCPHGDGGAAYTMQALVDHGAREAGRDHGHLRQPLLRDSQLSNCIGWAWQRSEKTRARCSICTIRK